MQVLQPAGWPKPKGFANGIAAEGRVVVVAGEGGVGNERKTRPTDVTKFIGQASPPTWTRRNRRPSRVRIS